MSAVDLAAYAREIAERGAQILEEACREAMAVAVATPTTITDARIETRVECCRGAGYRVEVSAGQATVTRCPCLTVLIVTRITA